MILKYFPTCYLTLCIGKEQNPDMLILALVFLSCSCMKSLSRPLLEVQLKDPETLAVSPLRNFATDILVRQIPTDAVL